MAPLLSEKLHKLPVYKLKEKIINAMQSSKQEIIIITGPTGCGKSYGTLEMAVEILREEKMVLCTQPRVQVVKSIFAGLKNLSTKYPKIKPGFLCGDDQQIPASCNIRIETHGILANELQRLDYTKIDSICDYFESYQMIIIDEVHERSVEHDIILALLNRIKSLLKNTEKKFPRIILMSATIDVALYRKFFGYINHIHIGPSEHQINVMYLKEVIKPSELLNQLPERVMEIYENNKHGNILVFLPRVKDIHELYNQLNIRKQSLMKKNKNSFNFDLYKLYRNMPAMEKIVTMKAATTGGSKNRIIIISTTVGETSITFFNLSIVIDSGLVNKCIYNHKINSDTNNLQLTTKDSASQRKGRVGRTSNGIVYRMYTQNEYNKMDEFDEPKVLITDLRTLILRLAAANQKVHYLNLINFPRLDDISICYKYLLKLDAVDADYNITDYGREMSKFQMKPHLSKMIIDSGFDNDIILLAIICDLKESIFYGNKLNDVAQKYSHNMSDHFTMFSFMRQFLKFTESEENLKRWCGKMNINYFKMIDMKNLYHKITNNVRKMSNLPATTARLMYSRMIKIHKIINQVADHNFTGFYKQVVEPRQIKTNTFFYECPYQALYSSLNTSSTDGTTYMNFVTIVPQDHEDNEPREECKTFFYKPLQERLSDEFYLSTTEESLEAAKVFYSDQYENIQRSLQFQWGKVNTAAMDIQHDDFSPEDDGSDVNMDFAFGRRESEEDDIQLVKKVKKRRVEPMTIDLE